MEDLEYLVALRLGEIEPAQPHLASALLMMHASLELSLATLGRRLCICGEGNSEREAARDQEACDV